jgi:hypothetical protein
MREAIFSDKRAEIAKITRDIVVLVRDDGAGLDAEHRREAEEVVGRLVSRCAYCRECACDMATLLLRRRFNDLVV